jgi:hypothetical protein
LRKKGLRSRSQSGQRGAGGAHVTYRQADKKLFAQMLHVVEKHHGKAVRAALELVRAGKVLGHGTPLSKAQRLARRFLDTQLQQRRSRSPGRSRARPPRPNRRPDDELFAQMQCIMEKSNGSAFRAALELVRAGKVAGKARTKSKAQRLATRFLDAQRRCTTRLSRSPRGATT